MTAILGGLGSAICFAISALCSTAASRSIGAVATLAWIMVLGLAVLVVPIALFAPASELSSRVVTLLVVAGVTNVLGLAFEYAAFRRGKVGVVTAISSTEGMVAAILSVIAGARISIGVFALLALISSGVALSAASPGDGGAKAGGAYALSSRGAVSFALVVPLLFGINLYATAKIGPHVSLLWIVLPARLTGALFIGVPLAVRRELRVTRPVLPLVGLAALAEIAGFSSYVIGANDKLAIAAVLSSEFAAIATTGAYFLFGERLTRHQLAGLGLVALGVALLGAFGA